MVPRGVRFPKRMVPNGALSPEDLLPKRMVPSGSSGKVTVTQTESECELTRRALSESHCSKRSSIITSLAKTHCSEWLWNKVRAITVSSRLHTTASLSKTHSSEWSLAITSFSKSHHSEWSVISTSLTESHRSEWRIILRITFTETHCTEWLCNTLV